MSNPLKRRFDPVRELDDEAFFTSSDASSVEPQQPYDQGPLDYGGYHDSMRQSQYHGPSYMNPMSSEIICYGMLHNVDVKLLGDMQMIYAKLDKREAGFERFKLETRENHIILCFNDTGEDFGQVRSNVGMTLSSLVDKSSNVDFEPIVSISYLMDIIGRANRPAEAIVKVDINVYGPQSIGIPVGNELSSGKLWLQKPTHERDGIVYDNPHFLKLKTNGTQLPRKQPMKQVISEGASNRRKREERLRKMVEDVYKSIDRTRHLEAVDGGDRVVRKLLKHQEEALGFMHLKDGVKVIKYHSSDRPKSLDEIADSDIVVTTYSTLTAEFQIKSSPSLLHCIDWYRIVLDEAHIIRRRATAFYRACDDIHANSRWCLTGTPIQNKLADIGTLFAFIRAEPFTKAATFRKYIEVPFDQSSEENPTLAKDRLLILIESLCLRRTRDIIQLPQLRQRVRKLSFSEAESKQYNNTKEILLRMIRHRVGEAEQSSKFGIFQVNLQMRLLCNHGTFQQPFSWHRRSYRDEREAIASALGQSSEITCAGCQMPMPIIGSSGLGDGFYKQCAHVLCSECIEQSNTSSDGEQTQHCPVCIRWLRPMVDSDQMTDDDDMANCPSNNKLGDDDAYYFNDEGHSTKMNALIEDVQRDMWTTKRTLQLLSRYLDAAKIPYVHIDGSCPLKQRQIKLDTFAKDDETPVLIMTTGTGGFGLNITCANRIFIVELQWNPAVESQAIARAIRLGQKNKEMQSQQLSKKQLANLGFDEDLDAGDGGGWFE
ncbi:hypothetical protein TrVFT333_007620 [Trichoderma virens FT-333]|nr:hypothetical protein TrVFT333_007620 [Trichoderma virens FT-333]